MVRTIAVRGSPWDGEQKGAIYLLGGQRSGNTGKMYKVWRNQSQANRWWFRRVVGGGTQPLPSKEGASIPALQVAISSTVRFTADVGGSREVYLYDAGSVYRYDEESGTLTCVLAAASYAAKTTHWKTGKPLPPPDEVVIADDGTAYLNWYRGSYPKGMVWRVSPDRNQVELVIFNPSEAAFDGPALQSYWFGGPQMNGYQPPNIILAGAVDDRWLRRLKDGRISTLCSDGEWREFATRGDALKRPHLYAGFGTNGWAMYRDSPYVYRTYGSKSDYATTIIRFGPVDWHKPTARRLLKDTNSK
ncbi:hypothetical protein HRbin36_00642 [bacterium HR36]|nr:hypothetical protein HRbin36_00642 [bacterium HR36]